MSQPIVVSLPHRLGKAEALRRLKASFSDAQSGGGPFFGFKNQCRGPERHSTWFVHAAALRTESRQYDLGTGPLGVLGNILWLILAGWWLALGHLITAIMLAITIVGIPFAWAHVKLAGLALWPIGKMIVPA